MHKNNIFTDSLNIMSQKTAELKKKCIHCTKNIFMIFNHNIFSFVKSSLILMIKSISFIVLTQFFHFNELKILRQPGYLFF